MSRPTLAIAVVDWRGMSWMFWPAGIVCLVGALLHVATGQRLQRD